MLTYIKGNIEYVQILAKQQIGGFLELAGYTLTMDDHNTEGIETRIFQWKNPESNRTIQLIWDGKEDWFDLGYFDSVDKTTLTNRIPITIQNFRRTKLLSRKTYAVKTVRILLDSLREKIN